jgi:hypothetical protein
MKKLFNMQKRFMQNLKNQFSSKYYDLAIESFVNSIESRNIK